jgi:hypothetical protein
MLQGSYAAGDVITVGVRDVEGEQRLVFHVQAVGESGADAPGGCESGA